MTIERKLALYRVTIPVSMSPHLNDEEIENGLLWVSDAVKNQHILSRGVRLGYQARHHFTHDVLPDEFWKGVKEYQENI
jgi:hypothetical protein